METHLSYEPWIKEDYLVPTPWRPVTLPPRLKIAIMWSDDIVTPHPSVTRALKKVAKSLLEAGIELVDWKPEGHDECWEITQALYYDDGGKHVEKLIAYGGDEMLSLTKWLIKDNKNVKYRTVEEIWDVCLIFLPPFLF
jgi:amidase